MVIQQHAPGSGELPCFTLDGDALEYGSSFGNAHCWLTTRGSGAIQQFFSNTTGRLIAGGVGIKYGGEGHHVLHASEERAAAFAVGANAQLKPINRGSIQLHPAYQRRAFDLPENLSIEETVFVPLTCDDDPALAYYSTTVTNRGNAPRRTNVYAFARLGTPSNAQVRARFEPQLRGFAAADTRRPDEVVVFGSTEEVTTFDTSLDYGRVYDVYHVSRLHNTTTDEGDILAGLHVSLLLQPNESRRITFILAFSALGEDAAIATYEGAHDYHAALRDTMEYIEGVCGTAEVLSPDPTINQGVQWSKVNMLRVRARYPTGPAFTNDPGSSANIVARDAAWFVYGGDHFMADFSRSLLDTFARLQHADGKIVEFYNAIDGHSDDYGLNINDDTPLFILAVNHHFRATGDSDWLRGIYPAVAKAARYIISQRDERGLVYCSANDPRGNVWAICSWRNIIPDYAINGAVTEINAECVAALRAAGHLTENLEISGTAAAEFYEASTQLRETMNRYLINPANGLYYLAIDARGVARTDVTGDLVFPVMFRACSEEVAFRIIRRLNHADFWTSAGLRTASCDDPLYDPMKNYGLLGGIWPGLTWWFAFAAARFHPDLMVRALKASFAHYAADPKRNNTVPGQFGEWFDGESLVNRGMRLSPWEPPRFLWAAIEGVCGVILQPGKIKVQPLVPAAWRWVALRHLPYHGQDMTFFATRERQDGRFHVYATTEIDTTYTVDVFEEDVTAMVKVLDPSVRHVALRRSGKAVLLLGQTGQTTVVVPIELGDLLADGDYTVRLYDSEAHIWRDGQFEPGLPDNGCSVTIESGGFRLLSFEQRASGRVRRRTPRDRGAATRTPRHR